MPRSPTAARIAARSGSRSTERRPWRDADPAPPGARPSSPRRTSPIPVLPNRMRATGPRATMAIRVIALTTVLAGLLGVGVEGAAGRAALVLAGLAGMVAPPGLATGEPPGRRGTVALGALGCAVVLMAFAVLGD